MKPGYKTTEFWLALVAVLIGAIIGSGILDAIPGQIDDQAIGIIATVLTALGYGMQRTWGKASEAKTAAIVAAATAPKNPQ